MRDENDLNIGNAKSFLDMIAPGVIHFYTDHYICGNTFRSVWAIREYIPVTKEKAILRHLGDKDGVTLKIESRQVSASEERKLLDNATKKNRMKENNTDDLKGQITAASNLQDVTEMIANMHRNREPLLHTAVFIELQAQDLESLKMLQSEVMTELSGTKLNVDRLLLRQKAGFLSVNPAGKNQFKEQFERVLPASSVANLFPFNYSGRTDAKGFYIGKDKYGSNIIVDFNKRTEDKTNSNILILGNSGQGKSYLLKLILTIMRESGMNIICLDPEHEYKDLAENLGGCFVDLMSGEYKINVLEPKAWDSDVLERIKESRWDSSKANLDKWDLEKENLNGGNSHDENPNEAESDNGNAKNVGTDNDDSDAPAAFTGSTKLSQHISFLRDFFRSYKAFSDAQIDTIEIMVERLYAKWNITDETDFSKLKSADYPILADLYDLIESEYKNFNLTDEKHLYTEEILREILLGLHSMCKGAESKFFSGHTNIKSSNFVSFGVKGLLQASHNVKDAMLFNILSYMSNELLTRGYTVAGIDEFYLFLSNLTAVEYIRNFSKRVRKKDSSVILASQNLEDFNIEGIKEYTKPLFSIPTHAFLFNAGNVDESFYRDTLQLEKSEYDLIKYPMRGNCLYKCGNDRYYLEVHAPEYKEALFGTAGGR